MALETGTYISDLVTTNPSGGDFVEQGDDHLRLIKSTLKTTFPNINAAVTATPGQLNNVALAYDHRVPTGVICMWSGASTAIPTGWLLCDGTSSTPDLRDRFLIGAGSTYAVGATGGSKDAIVVAHTHSVTGSTSTNGNHTHGVSDPGHSHTAAFQGSANPGGGYPGLDGSGDSINAGSTSSSGTGISIQAGGDHSHTVTGTAASTGSSGTNANLPPYYALCFIMKS
jgi:hypothetical protein